MYTFIFTQKSQRLISTEKPASEYLYQFNSSCQNLEATKMFFNYPLALMPKKDMDEN